ncbi:hypothetical protein JHD50_11440 [Sulfurimonas sp. MAG313]|nr:hypothetical protein [Sulfurimonas sp. MAG313]MDF1881902.1 hypothetical protein [Sulfurimonas sp. MAG313]
MLTLFMLLAMSASLSITLALFQKNFKISAENKFRVQSAVLMVDGVNLMRSLENDIKGNPDAFILLVQSAQELPLQVGEVDMILRIRPLNAKFNINRYERDKHFEKIYAYLLEYEVQRPGYILDIIEDSLDEDKDEKQYGSERVLYDPFFLQGENSIKDNSVFLKLLDVYAKETKDINIYKVPWSDWIDFTGEFIDESFITVEMLRVLEASGGISNLLSDFTETGTNENDLNCEIYLRQEQSESIANFNYSFKTKTITNFKAIL